MTRRNLAIALGVVVILLAVWWLRPKNEGTPEDQVRAALDHAVKAAEAKDLDQLMELISDDFRSGELDRHELQRILFAQLHLNSWRSVTLTGTQVELEAPDRAKVNTSALLAAGQKGLDLSGSIYEFELRMKKNGRKWQVNSAQWHPKP